MPSGAWQWALYDALLVAAQAAAEEAKRPQRERVQGAMQAVGWLLAAIAVVVAATI